MRRSNLESLRGWISGCFVPLAMTEDDATASLSPPYEIPVRGTQFRSQTYFRSLAADFARALLHLRTLKSKRAQGRPGADRHPRSAARIARARRKPHSSIQVVPITRPSLRDGRTAYAVLSREPNFPLASLAVRIGLCRPPGWARAHLRSGLTVATTARTTRFCRTHGPPCRRSISNPVDGAENLQARRSLAAPLVHTRFRAHRDTPPCPHLSCRRCRVHRKPGSRSRRPRDRPSW
jgi:hypothetical protein